MSKVRGESMGTRDIQISISGTLDVVKTKKEINDKLKTIQTELPKINLDLFKDEKGNNKIIKDLESAVSMLKKEYASYGDMVVKTSRNNTGALTGFEIEIKNAIGIITKLKYAYDSLGKKGGMVSLLNINDINKEQQAVRELQNKIDIFKTTMQQKTAPFANVAELKEINEKINQLNPNTYNVIHVMKQLALAFKEVQAAGQLKFDSIKTVYADITRANESITKLTAQMNQAQMGGKTAAADQLQVQLTAERVKLKDLETKQAIVLAGFTQEQIKGLQQEIQLQETLTREKQKANLASAKGKDTEAKVQITEATKAYKEYQNAIAKLYSLKNEMAKKDTVYDANTLQAQKERLRLAAQEVAVKREAITSGGFKSQENELQVTKQLIDAKAKLNVEQNKYLDSQIKSDNATKNQLAAFQQTQLNKLTQLQKTPAGALVDTKALEELKAGISKIDPMAMNLKQKMLSAKIAVSELIAETKLLETNTRKSDNELIKLFSQLDASYARISNAQKQLALTAPNTQSYKAIENSLMQEISLYDSLKSKINAIADSVKKTELAEASILAQKKSALQLETELAKASDNEYKIQLQKLKIFKELFAFESSKINAAKRNPIPEPIIPKEILVGATKQMETLAEATRRVEKEFAIAKAEGIKFGQAIDKLRTEILSIDTSAAGAANKLALLQSRFKSMTMIANEEVQSLERVRNEIIRVQNLGQKSDKIKYSGYQIEDLKRYANELNKTGQVINPVIGHIDRLGNIQSQVTVKIKEGAKAYREYKITTDALSKSVYVLQGELKHVSAKDLGMMGQFEVAMQRFPIWMAATTVYMQMVTAIRDSVKYIFEMDAALIELAKVTSLSTEKLETMKNAAVNLGIELGHSSVDVMKSMAEFGRVSKNPEDILRLAEVATIAGNVTTMTAQTAAQSMNTAMIAFKINAKDSMDILDSWNEIQNNFRTTAEDLAEGIGKVGAVARQSGTSIQELEGYITAINSATGISGSEAGTAMKSIISRIYRVGEEGVMDAGKAEEALAEIDVGVRNASGEFESAGTILKDLGEKWKTMSTIEKTALAQTVAGKMCA
jgi:TP901 family phage tail tape measure protein